MNLLLKLLIGIVFLFGCQKSDVVTDPITVNSAYKGTGSVTQGVAKTTVSSLFSCSGGRPTAVGTISSTDGKSWVVPAENNFASGLKLADLFNECNGKSPSNLAAANLSSTPTIIIDEDGEIITGYIHGDNYFELYVNGKFVGVDAVPFTPFNSTYVKFKAKRPIKYAIKLVDWEENLGIGSEANGGNSYHPGDGGFVANFSDGTSTNSSWKAQTFYIAPLADLNCVTESGTSRLSSNCSSSPSTGAKSYALHWELPSNWFASNFDFSTWPNATIFTASQVGVKQAYGNFTTQFSPAQFIWSSNLILDNLVLLRFTGK